MNEQSLNPNIKSPIQCLEKNIVHCFQNIDPSALPRLEQSLKARKLQKDIELDCIRASFQTPQITEDGLIKLNVVHLEYLWSYIYSTFVIYEEGIQRRQVNKEFNGRIEFNTPLLSRARSLQVWALSLPHTISEWDLSLPNPQRYIGDKSPDNEDHDLYAKEKYFAEITNRFFQEAVSFLMFHEFAHIELEHLPYYNKLIMIPEEAYTQQHYADFIQMENDADRFALDMVKKQQSGDDDILYSIFPILTVLCSSIQVSKSPRGLEQSKHPKLHDRIYHLIQNFDLKEEKNKFYAKQYTCFCITQFIYFYDLAIIEKQKVLFLKGVDYFDEIHILDEDKIKYNASTYETIDDYILDLLDILDSTILKLKEKYD